MDERLQKLPRNCGALIVLLGLLGVAGCVDLLVTTCEAAKPGDKGFQPEEAGFTIAFGTETTNLRVIGVYVLPGEIVPIQVAGSIGVSDYALDARRGGVLDEGNGTWTWIAPEQPGLYPVTLHRKSPPDSIILNLFVMVPYKEIEGESLHGYRIGCYPTTPLKSLPETATPGGFIEITAANKDTPVSPHFRLKQFLCKQESGYPKYIILNERLLLKLERILQMANEKGFRCDTFHIMSGYRTPHYNKAIGNVRYSQHLWGNAADIFIDENPKDGMMDDLNRDGKIDFRDAAVLYDIINEMSSQSSHDRFLGGLARYKKTQSHGPFVHVDVRGISTRWGI